MDSEKREMPKLAISYGIIQVNSKSGTALTYKHLFSIMTIPIELYVSFLDACRDDDLEKIRELLNQGADVNWRDVLNGSTGLHWATSNGNLAAVKLLLENGADPNIYTQNTMASSLGTAFLVGDLQIIETLLAAGACLSMTEYEIVDVLLSECREHGKYESVKILESERFSPPRS